MYIYINILGAQASRAPVAAAAVAIASGVVQVVTAFVVVKQRQALVVDAHCRGCCCLTCCHMVVLLT